MFDVIYFANPYDLMVNPIHSVNYLTNKDILPIYINYGYDIGLNTTLMRLLSYELNIPWKIFTDTTYSLNDYNKYQPMHGENVILSGYAKMDKLYTYSNSYKHKNGRKKILISPHHTVDMKMLPLSNFLLYFDEIKNLPLKYDMVDFVFRPHPLLFTTLINHGYWTEEQVHNYIKDIQNNGMIYSKESDYLHLFFECDAIINDCGSFTVEWLFTGKPGCFMLNKDLKSYHVTQLMKKSLEKYNIAKNFKDVESFIEKIVNENFDDNVVEDWIKDNIMINYPDVSEKIIEELNSRLIQI